MVLVVTFYNVIIGQKKSSPNNNIIKWGFFQYTFELQWNLGGGSGKGAIKVKKICCRKKSMHIYN